MQKRKSYPRGITKWTDCSIYNSSGLRQTPPNKRIKTQTTRIYPSFPQCPSLHNLTTLPANPVRRRFPTSHNLKFLFAFPLGTIKQKKTMSVSSASLFLQPYFRQCPSLSPSGLSFFCPLSSFHISVASGPTTATNKPAAAVTCCVSSSQQFESHVSVVNGNIDNRISERDEIRLGLPSKGRMAADTLDLLKVSV